MRCSISSALSFKRTSLLEDGWDRLLLGQRRTVRNNVDPVDPRRSVRALFVK